MYVWHSMLKAISGPVPYLRFECGHLLHSVQVSTQDTADVGSQEYGHVPEAVQVWEVYGEPVAAVESVTDPEGNADCHPQQADVAQFPGSAIFAPVVLL